MIYRVVLLGGAIMAVLTTTAFAQQTQTYSYDVHGRLTSATRTTGASNQTTIYALDKANNRTSRAVSTASSVLVNEPLASAPETSDSFDPQRSDSEAQDKDVLAEVVPVSSVNDERGDEL